MTNKRSDLFHTTRWSIVLGAADSLNPQAKERALAELCQSYWPPVYTYLLCKGYSKVESEDLCQGFFTQVLEKKTYVVADAERGRFRAFLIRSLKNYLSNVYQRDQALKRGAGNKAICLDKAELEKNFTTMESPDEAFDKEWAESMVHVTLDRLRESYSKEGREALFTYLQNLMIPTTATVSQADLAESLDMTEVAVKSALQRMRKSFRTILREEISQTISTQDKASIDTELRYLLDCLRS